MLFVAVALFGLLAFAFLQGSRSNTAIITGEAGKVATYQAQDCTNAVSLAIRRLNSRGCEGMLSLNTNGTNASPGAPADGSCSVYHPNGGGVAPCDVVVAVVEPCTVPNIGDECPDGSIYAGMSPDGNRRMYTTPNDGPTLPWNNGNGTGYAPTGAISATAGFANTMAAYAIDADTNTPEFEYHLGAQYCAELVAHQHDDWYIPAMDEMQVIGDNQEDLPNIQSGAPYPACHYMVSTEANSDLFSAMHFWGAGNGEAAATGLYGKENVFIVRCVRKD